MNEGPPAGGRDNPVEWDAARQWLAMWRGALEELRQARDEIDRLNVFPVPDGDTGHNLYATVESLVGSFRTSAEQTDAATALRDAVRRAGDAALYGARGNSGVILSQWIRGLSEVLLARGDLNGPAFALGLARGAEEARRHVKDPKPGTILTVADSAAEVSVAEDLLGVLDQAIEHAKTALQRTTGQLDALRRAGVVDAGGRGLVAVLQGFRQGLTGEPRLAPVVAAPEGLRMEGVHEWDVRYPYDVEALVAPEETVPVATWENRLSELGTSVVVATGLGTAVKVHVHTDRPVELLRRLLAWGAVWQMEVLDMRHQVEDHASPAQGRAVVMCPTDWEPLFWSLGMSPDAVRGIKGTEVFTVAADGQSVRLTSPGQTVAVLQAEGDGRPWNPPPSVREWVLEPTSNALDASLERTRIVELVGRAADQVVTVFLAARASEVEAVEAMEAEWWEEKLNAVVVPVPGLPVQGLILAT